MASPAKTKSPKTAEPETTAPQARDAFGRLLDSWGLPVNGPCRVAALEAIGLPDPNDDPSAWKGVEPPAPLEFATPEPSAPPATEVRTPDASGISNAGDAGGKTAEDGQVKDTANG